MRKFLSVFALGLCFAVGCSSSAEPGQTREVNLVALAGKLKAAGLESIKGDHYEGGHWLGSFAVYLVSGRGLR